MVHPALCKRLWILTKLTAKATCSLPQKAVSDAPPAHKMRETPKAAAPACTPRRGDAPHPERWPARLQRKTEARIRRAPPSRPSGFPRSSPGLTFGLDVEEHRLRPRPVSGQRGGLDAGRVVARVEPVQLGPSVLPVFLPGHAFPLVLERGKQTVTPPQTHEKPGTGCPGRHLPPDSDPDL